MNGYDYILAKQTSWAANSGLTLVGSKGTRGRPAYTSELDQNLFQPLLPEVRKSFAAGLDSQTLQVLGEERLSARPNPPYVVFYGSLISFLLT